MCGSTSNRNKREADFQRLSPSCPRYNHLHVAKKRKSSSLSSPYIASRSSVSKLSLYPQQVTPIDREIHAPCTVVSGFNAKKRCNTSCNRITRQKSAFLGDDMEDTDALFLNYSHAKKSAIGSCRHAKFEVVDVDNVEIVKDDMIVSVNSRIENVEIVEEIAAKYKALDQKFVHQTTSLRRLRLAVKLALRQQSRVAKRKEDLANDPFRSLTEEEEEMVANALSYSIRSKILVTHENSNITITGEVLRCLGPRAWLNDEIINLYLELLKERENREPKLFLKCHFFNTFFYKKLISGRTGYDYKSVRRWTSHRRLGYSLLDCDKIFVPIHKEIHWCLAVINKKERKFQYLDSLGGADKKVLRMLVRYFTDEVKDKTGENIDVTSWEQEFVTGLPVQENGFDCGMFMIKYVDFCSRGIGLCFNQEHMPYFRSRTAKEILKLRAE